MFRNLNPSEIEEVLSHQLVGRIGCHADGKTYVVPISYAYDGGFVYAHTFEGLKVSIMRKNPAVCFQVDNMSDMANWKSVITWGQYEELTNTDERKKALGYLTRRTLPLVSSETTHLGKVWPFLPEDLNRIDGIVFRIRLEEKTGKAESNKVPASTINFG